MRRRQYILILLAVAGLGAFSFGWPAAAQTPAGSTPLPGHVLGVLPQASKLSRRPAAAGEPLTLTVILNRSDQSGFDAFVKGVEDQASTSFRHFLSQADLAGRFGPSQAAYDAALAYLKQGGFTLVEGSANRLTLTVRGTRSQAEKAFGVSIDDYQLGSRTFYANDRDPSLPAALAPSIQAIAGLSNLAQPQPNIANAPAPATPASTAPSPTPYEIAAAYDFGGAGLGIDGGNQTIGLLEFDNFCRCDVSDWLNLLGAPADPMNRLSTRDVNGGTTASNGLGTSEVLLDVDTVIAMAPGANYVVYDAPNGTSFQTMFNAMIGDGVQVISNSWSDCEPNHTTADLQSIDAILAAGAASGVSVYTASGDDGPTCVNGAGTSYAATVDVPSDSPHGTAVGGTTLQVTDQTTNTYQNESWWNGNCASGPCAGGYGVSGTFQTPFYQAPFTTSTMRSVPDVSADADPNSGIWLCQAVEINTGDVNGCPDRYNGAPALHGGTSLAAPIWAAATALLN